MQVPEAASLRDRRWFGMVQLFYCIWSLPLEAADMVKQVHESCMRCTAMQGGGPSSTSVSCGSRGYEPALELLLSTRSHAQRGAVRVPCLPCTGAWLSRLWVVLAFHAAVQKL